MCIPAFTPSQIGERITHQLTMDKIQCAETLYGGNKEAVETMAQRWEQPTKPGDTSSSADEPGHLGDVD